MIFRPGRLVTAVQSRLLIQRGATGPDGSGLAEGDELSSDHAGKLVSVPMYWRVSDQTEIYAE